MERLVKDELERWDSDTSITKENGRNENQNPDSKSVSSGGTASNEKLESNENIGSDGESGSKGNEGNRPNTASSSTSGQIGIS